MVLFGKPYIYSKFEPHGFSMEVIAPWENHWRKASAVRCPALMTPLLCQARATNLWALRPELPPTIGFRKPVPSIPSTPIDPETPQIISIFHLQVSCRTSDEAATFRTHDHHAVDGGAKPPHGTWAEEGWTSWNLLACFGV